MNAERKEWIERWVAGHKEASDSRPPEDYYVGLPLECALGMILELLPEVESTGHSLHSDAVKQT